VHIKSLHIIIIIIIYDEQHMANFLYFPSSNYLLCPPMKRGAVVSISLHLKDEIDNSGPK